MGNYITYEKPITEASWTHAYIDRSLEQSANYSPLTSQIITDNTFYDEGGSNNHWYRLRFFNSSSSIYSEYTAPFQADQEYYCTPRDVAKFLGRPQFDDSTNPTRFAVEEIIADVTKEIEERTHHAWKKTRVTNEYYDVRVQDRFRGYNGYPYDYSTRIALLLKHRKLRPFVSGTTKIEVWNGASWVDFVSTYTEGRANDYWINYDRGIIYFVNRYPLLQRSNVRVTYDYGETLVDRDIKRAAILLTASYIVGGKEDLNVVYPESTMGTILNTDARWEKYREDAEQILKKREEFISLRSY